MRAHRLLSSLALVVAAAACGTPSRRTNSQVTQRSTQADAGTDRTVAPHAGAIPRVPTDAAPVMPRDATFEPAPMPGRGHAADRDPGASAPIEPPHAGEKAVEVTRAVARAAGSAAVPPGDAGMPDATLPPVPDAGPTVMHDAGSPMPPPGSAGAGAVPFVR
jgi:hypothetical protein